MTPTEMVLTATSCTNTHCAMSVAQQLISQSRIWHAVDVMDAKQMEESSAKASTIPRQRRAMIRKFGKDTLSAQIPSVAGVLGWSRRPGAIAPSADTPANLLLLQALSFRRQSRKGFQSLQKDAAPDMKASLWEQEISDALRLGKGTFVPSDEDEKTEHDNSKRAALKKEYELLCYSGDKSTLRNINWSKAGPAYQSPSASGPGNKSAPGPLVVDKPDLRCAAIPGIPDSENKTSSNPSGSASQPGYFVGKPSQNSSATVNTSHDSGDAMQGPAQTGQMATTQPAFQNGALTYDQPPFGNPFAKVSGSQAQPVPNIDGSPQIQSFANMGGPPPQTQPDANMDNTDGPPPHAQPVANTVDHHLLGAPPPSPAANTVDHHFLKFK